MRRERRHKLSFFSPSHLACWHWASVCVCVCGRERLTCVCVLSLEEFISKTLRIYVLGKMNAFTIKWPVSNAFACFSPLNTNYKDRKCLTLWDWYPVIIINRDKKFEGDKLSVRFTTDLKSFRFGFKDMN